MAGSAGALRTLRLSGANGSRTYGSMIASTDGGAGSTRRLYYWYKKTNPTGSPYQFWTTYLNRTRN